MGKIFSIALLFASFICSAQSAITHYDLKFSFDFEEKKLFCQANIKITKTDTLHLLLYRLLTVRSVRDNNGHALPFTQKITAFTDWDQLQANTIQVVTNNSTELQIEYDGYLAGYTETGMMYTKDRIDPSYTTIRPDCFTYPTIGINNWEKNSEIPESFFDYKVTVTVPDSLTVVNGGKLLERTINNRKSTYTYVNIKPAWRIDVAIAKYKAYNEKDFIIQYFPEDSSRINITADYIKKAFAMYEKWFGKRTGPPYTIIEIPDGWGSQTDVTSILQEASAVKNEKKLYELYHEISHTWNLRPLDGNPSRIESEGLAVFLQYLLMQKLNGDNNALEAGAERSLQRAKRQFQKNPRSVNIPVSEYGVNQLTDLSYSKGMLFFYILYKKYGEEKLMSSIAEYYRKFKTSATLRDFAESITADKNIVNDWIWTAKSSEIIMGCENVGCLVKKWP